MVVLVLIMADDVILAGMRAVMVSHVGRGSPLRQDQ